MSKQRKVRITREVNMKLLDGLARADRTPAELAAGLGLTMVQLADWCAEPQTVQALSALALMHDVRGQMLLSNFRAHAAIKLVEIVSSGELSELTRKACVDLLRLNMHMPEVDVSKAAPARPPSEKAILRAFEQLGRDQDAAMFGETRP